MRTILFLLLFSPSFAVAQARFEMQEIDTKLKIGYAVITADVDGDKKLDIVVVDQHQVVWYQNPSWKKRILLNGKTPPDNVCIAALDIDRDGLPEFVIGAGWKPFDTKTPGSLHWLRRGKTIDEEWSLFSIPNDEPTIHRIRAQDIDGDGQPELISVPLMGREATRDKNWMDGRPLRITAYKVPAQPENPMSWKPVVLHEELHVAHNLDWHPTRKGLVVVSYEGVSFLEPSRQLPWKRALLNIADQSKPNASRGASEVRVSSSGEIATIEPWHGNQVVVYSADGQDRQVLDRELRWGHALAWGSLDGNGSEVLVVGVRDNPEVKQGDQFTVKRGVRLYSKEAKTKTWSREIVEDGGVAVEDLTIADLDADGRPEIIAVGRATGNARIYWSRR
jgi:FG-GAP-like repeat